MWLQQMRLMKGEYKMKVEFEKYCIIIRWYILIYIKTETIKKFPDRVSQRNLGLKVFISYEDLNLSTL